MTLNAYQKNTQITKNKPINKLYIKNPDHASATIGVKLIMNKRLKGRQITSIRIFCIGLSDYWKVKTCILHQSEIPDLLILIFLDLKDHLHIPVEIQY